MCQKQEIHFRRHRKKGKKIVPPAVKLRHAKVVVSRQYPQKPYPREKPVVTCFRPDIASFGVFLSPRRLLGEV